MTPEPQVSIKLASNPLYLCGARELVSSVARRLGFADEACCQIALAVDEALANIIRHGYDRRADGPIWVKIYPCDRAGRPICPDTESDPECGGLRIVIEDEARQVDPTSIQSRNLDEIRPGGLGVHIIRQVMDEARYERRADAGMRLILVKRLPAGVPSISSLGSPAARHQQRV